MQIKQRPGVAGLPQARGRSRLNVTAKSYSGPPPAWNKRVVVPEVQPRDGPKVRRCQSGTLATPTPGSAMHVLGVAYPLNDNWVQSERCLVRCLHHHSSTHSSSPTVGVKTPQGTAGFIVTACNSAIAGWDQQQRACAANVRLPGRLAYGVGAGTILAQDWRELPPATD